MSHFVLNFAFSDNDWHFVALLCAHAKTTHSLLRFFSMRFFLFSSLSLASSSSWSCLHLWKFSTTTPTNMLSTKKLTISRKEIKYRSIQGLWFLTGCKERRTEKSFRCNVVTLINQRGVIFIGKYSCVQSIQSMSSIKPGIFLCGNAGENPS